ncbi:hypothetical protein A6D98_19515 [Aliivibrio fischeri]|uniref:hypothetical protein n=1 Tax=Aliivibrio TaxID=511678 RepID=UPI00080E07BE|nr:MULTISPECIES: hypothetical protein [Aliivibrio]OCH01455.1 hypothetical protein A6E10_19055 [Aliivibrio fischeri]OCH16166.1 hypothetical protein A6E05_17135 [Aliivibrio sp. 1S165]OCH22736.1 hypothetical protein A6E12_18825 [Aliivibrio fischeri]OCH32045.1 hypothetical protein A6E06_18970 [Aliivibrio sp. 1S175]OCH57399.1 hypothetical protein A6D98_19515 [Aliivibrio fischeri]
MIEYLELMYSQPAERAQFMLMVISSLLTALLSLFIAFFVVKLTESGANKKSHKEFTISKLEELYKATLEFEDQFIVFCSPIADFNDRNIIVRPQDSLIKCEMYKKLYFSDMTLDRIQLNQAMVNIYLDSRREELSCQERLEIFQSNKRMVQDFIDMTKGFCEQMLLKHKL